MSPHGRLPFSDGGSGDGGGGGGRGAMRAGLVGFAGDDLDRLPWVLRILLENALRHDAHLPAKAILAWLETGTSQAEIPFYPARLLMHDTTCVPALVDIAAMRSELAEAGQDPSALNPRLPINVSVDHSIAVDTFGVSNALQQNMTQEIQRNAERYRLLKWATHALNGLRVHPPGTGIMHTLNLEQLATVVVAKDGWMYPDTLIGTDSHTPMINGIGVLAWGVGGLEAETVMFGMPVMLKIPEVIGVRMTGALPHGMLATDLALTVTERLRKLRLSGKFVEFFGPGVSTLSAGERAVIANMAPEYGASCGFFPVDQQTLEYLRVTGRAESHIASVEAYCKDQRLWFDPQAVPRYTEVLDLDLGMIETSIAGPHRPQDRLTPAATIAWLARASKPTPPTPVGGRADAATRANGDGGPLAGAGTRGRTDGLSTGAPPNGAVAIAAITSCTNTSDPRLLMAAGLLANKARRLGLRPPSWVKTSLAPGSPAAELYLQRSGLLSDLEALGFGIVGFGCTTCIGNSGALVPEMAHAIESHSVLPVAVLSGNRNFPGRVHPQIEASFLASPPLVIAYALAGHVNLNILQDPIDGKNTYLRDLWPTGTEIDAALASVRPADFQVAHELAEQNEAWSKLDAPTTPLFPWNKASTYIRRPPFASRKAKSRLGSYTARPLIALGDDITTDHISPAGQIPADSSAAQYLVARGEDPKDLNVFASRRGNWEVMLRGLFTNRSVRNLLDSPTEPLWITAERYKSEGTSLVVVAGERYGTGSSRDWAAKGLWLLGIRAVLALSFERIHRSNLIGMGIIPLQLSAPLTGLTARSTLEIRAEATDLSPGAQVSVTVRDQTFLATAAVETALEVELLRAGGILPYILRSTGK
jgi:aconitate hydratase